MQGEPQPNPATQPPYGSVHALASRGSRLGGAVLDGLLYVVVAAPVSYGLMDFDPMSEPDLFLYYAKVGIPILLVAMVQWYLVATTGQTVAKKLLGMKIVKTTGENVNFVSGVVVRRWVPACLGWSPYVGPLLYLIDLLFIFGDERRCLHDKLAGTKVIAL